MTYSIIGRDPENQEIGAAVQSKFPGVGSIVLHGRAGVGCVTTQAFANPRHGEIGLNLLSTGATARIALNDLLHDDPSRGRRQVAILGTADEPAPFSGADVLGWKGWAGSATGRHSVALGNALVREGVVNNMVDCFQETRGDLANRLIHALRAGRDAGGEIRGQQSAAILVVKPGGGYGGWSGRHVDISVYDHQEPIEELARCLRLHRLSYFPSDPEPIVPIDGNIAREAKWIMRIAEFCDLPDSPDWGERENALLERFMGTENYDNRLRTDGLIDLDVLEDLRTRFNQGKRSDRQLR